MNYNLPFDLFEKYVFEFLVAFLFFTFIFVIIIYLSGSVANEEVGLPLRIFGRGNLCHPYLSLSYIDALSQPCVRGYIIGKFRYTTIIGNGEIMHHILTKFMK